MLNVTIKSEQLLQPVSQTWGSIVEWRVKRLLGTETIPVDTD